jgi:hypothetical protein
MKNLPKSFIIFFSLIFFYFIISSLIYTLSSFALLKGKVFNFLIITEYQRNFYHQLGFRKIWQNQRDCIEYDKDLIFKPRHGICKFDNVEFRTQLNFSYKGRLHGTNIKSNTEEIKGIAVIGDSHAMGWGVNDDETFSYILEKKVKKPVYNLAVSGYATNREILALEKSKLVNKIDTVIIQYCNNDYYENMHFSENKSNNNYSKFQEIQANNFSIFKRLRKGFRYAVTIPLKHSEKRLDWRKEENYFLNILNNYDFLKEKKIIVIYSNGHEIYYDNFKLNTDTNIKNINFINIDYKKNDFFLIDGHLNKEGHLKVADKLYDFINNNKY